MEFLDNTQRIPSELVISILKKERGRLGEYSSMGGAFLCSIQTSLRMLIYS